MESLPRQKVADHLERVDKESCIAYLEHIIRQLDEQGPDLHDKLARLYLEAAREQAGDGESIASL